MDRLYILNPYDKNHINLLMSYEKENSISTKSLEVLGSLSEKITEEEYLELKKKSNDIEMSLFIEEAGKVKDLCFIQGEKDRKTCKLYFTPVTPRTKTRKLLNLATDFALNTLGMESVFVITTREDKTMHANLEGKGYECLGLENNSVIYLKEQELEMTHHKAI